MDCTRGRYASAIAVTVLFIAMAGCPSPAIPELPDTFDVNISATEKAPAPKNSGPPDLANSSWAAFRKPGPDEPDTTVEPPPGPYGGLLNGVLPRPPADQQFFIVEFGDAGQMTRITGNQYFLPDIYGSEVVISEEWTPTPVPSLLFRSAAYGLQDDSRYGLATIVQVQAAGAYVGRAIIYSWGTLGELRIDGTFGYLLDFEGGTGGAIFPTGGDQYPFYAEKK